MASGGGGDSGGASNDGAAEGDHRRGEGQRREIELGNRMEEEGKMKQKLSIISPLEDLKIQNKV